MKTGNQQLTIEYGWGVNINGRSNPDATRWGKHAPSIQWANGQIAEGVVEDEAHQQKYTHAWRKRWETKGLSDVEY